jgi:thiol-disulfide isomerase/thioredoxin
VTTSKKRSNKIDATSKDRTKQTRGSDAQGRKTERKIPWIGIVFGVVAVALVAAIVFSSDEAIGSEFGDVEIEGEALAPFAPGGADPAVGAPAPEFSGVDFDGETVVVENDGTAKAIVFLAHWCPHCQAEVPRVQAWIDGGGGVDGVELYSVSTSMSTGQPNHPPSEWLDREGWTVPVVRDNEDSDLLSSFGGSAFPFYVFVNADGTVAGRTSGELDISTLEAAMQSIAP